LSEQIRYLSRGYPSAQMTATLDALNAEEVALGGSYAREGRRTAATRPACPTLREGRESCRSQARRQRQWRGPVRLSEQIRYLSRGYPSAQMTATLDALNAEEVALGYLSNAPRGKRVVSVAGAPAKAVARSSTRATLQTTPGTMLIAYRGRQCCCSCAWMTILQPEEHRAPRKPRDHVRTREPATGSRALRLASVTAGAQPRPLGTIGSKLA
jgi:hypothetical protein